MMKRTTGLLLLLAVLLAACAQGGAGGTKGAGPASPSPAASPAADNGGKDGKPFLVGLILVQTTGAMETARAKLEKTLADKLGRSVSVQVFPDYNAVVEALGSNKIQLAYLGPLTYVIAHEKYGAEAIVTFLINGEPYYYSYFITQADSPYQSFDDVVKHSKDIRFAFGDVSSTSGSPIPGMALRKAGVFTSQEDHKFKSVHYTGNHDATALAIQNKGADVGAIDSAIFDSLVKNGKIDGSKIKVIWKSQKLFQYPWAVEKNVPAEDREKLREAFLGITDPDILNVFGASGFTKATNDDYADIRQAAIEAGRLK